MANAGALDPQTISAVDKSLGRYLSRLLTIADDLSHIGKQLEGFASERNLNGKLLEDTYFLRSSAYKLAQEGLILSNLLISSIAHIAKTLPSDHVKIVNALADAVHEKIDPQLHKLLIEHGSHRHRG